MTEPESRTAAHFNIMAVLAVLVTTAAAETTAQTLPVPLDRLYGSWEGRGTLFGNDAEFSMKWRQVLSGAFVRLDFRNAIVRNGTQDTVLTAVGYYRVNSPDDIVGTWLDSRAVVQPLHGAVSDSSLVVHWGEADTEQGKTVYTLGADGTVQVVDSVLSDGDWRGFAEAVYERVRGDGRGMLPVSRLPSNLWFDRSQHEPNKFVHVFAAIDPTGDGDEIVFVVHVDNVG